MAIPLLKSKRSILLLGISLLAFSCEKAQDCFSKNGKDVRKNIELDPYESVSLQGNIALVLNNDEDAIPYIIAPDQLIDQIAVEQIDKTLNVINNNFCKWSKAAVTSIKLVLPVKNKLQITHAGSLGVHSLQTLENKNLNFLFDGATGNTNLSLSGGTISITNLSIENITLKGSVNHLNVNMQTNDGLFNALELKSKTVTVKHNGYTDLSVNASEELNGSINNVGDLIYTGEGKVNVENLERGGHLIKK